jgi:hypothetical protein
LEKLDERKAQLSMVRELLFALAFLLGVGGVRDVSEFRLKNVWL